MSASPDSVGSETVSVCAGAENIASIAAHRVKIFFILVFVLISLYFSSVYIQLVSKFCLYSTVIKVQSLFPGQGLFHYYSLIRFVD